MTITKNTFASLATSTLIATSLLTNSAGATPDSGYSVTVEDCDVDQCGVVNVSDIVSVLEALGSSCQTCRTDVDDSTSSDINDLLHVISRYGDAADWSLACDSPLNGGILALQNHRHSNVAPVHESGLANTARAISTYCFSARFDNPEQFEEVLNTSAEEIADYLAYNAEVYDIDFDTDEYLILDIEGYKFSPRYWGDYITEGHELYNPELLDRILDAYAVRIAVTRDLFPNAKLALWDIGSPHGSGVGHLESMLRRVRGYEYASEYGVYDQLDCISPRMYQCFGPSDQSHWRNMDMIDLGVVTANALTKSDGSALQVLPMLSLTIFNGNSNHDRMNAPVEDVADSITRLKSQGINEYLIWNGMEGMATPDSSTSDYAVTRRVNELADYMIAAGF